MSTRRISRPSASILLAVAAFLLNPHHACFADPGHLADAYQLDLEFDTTAKHDSSAALQLVHRTEESDAMLREAVRAMGEGRDADALAIYREGAKTAPEQFLPPLARHLALTGLADELAQLADRCAAGEISASPLARARVLAEAGREGDALEILLADGGLRSGADAAEVKLAARLLREAERDEERELLLVEVMAAVTDPARKALYWNELLAGTMATTFAQPSLLLQAMGQGLQAAATSRSAIIEKLDDAIIRFQHSPGYFKVRQETLDTAPKYGAGAVWFATRMLVREERHEDALAYLTEREPSMRVSKVWPILAAERAELLRQTGRMEEFRSAIETLATQSQSGESMAFLLESARAALSAGNNARAMEAIGQIDPARLPADLRRDWLLARLLAVAREGDIPRIVALYPETIDTSRAEDVELFEHAIFSTLIETAQHVEIEQRVRAAFHDDPATSPTLWRLAARAAVEARRKPNELEALYQYVVARPSDTAALDRLAAVAAPLAAELAQAPREVIAIPQEEVESTIKLAGEALRTLARRKPLDPDAYRLLLDLRAAQGKAAEGVAEAVELARAANSSAARANVAFVLATGGHPADALPIYDELLEEDPADMPVRMNRAACLTRLDRWDEAIAFYREVLIKGHDGRPWHEHELVQRLWQIAKHLGREKECIEWFRTVGAESHDEQSLARIENIAAQLANDGFHEDSRWFLDEVLARTTDSGARARAWSRLIRAHTDASEVDEALALFAKAEEDLRPSPEHFVDMKLQHAEYLVAQGRIHEGADLMLATSHESPEDQFAADAIHRAALLLDEAGETERAAELYREFLASSSRTFDRRNNAQSRLAELESK